LLGLSVAKTRFIWTKTSKNNVKIVFFTVLKFFFIKNWIEKHPLSRKGFDVPKIPPPSVVRAFVGDNQQERAKWQRNSR
jgi:hypothetical protein